MVGKAIFVTVNCHLAMVVNRKSAVDKITASLLALLRAPSYAGKGAGSGRKFHEQGISFCNDPITLLKLGMIRHFLTTSKLEA